MPPKSKSTPKKQKRKQPKKNGQLPLSGYEPLFMEHPWGTPTGIRTANCYSYALDSWDPTRTQKAVPGDSAGIKEPLNYLNCKDLKKRVLADNPKHVYTVKPTKPCKKGFFKTMMFIDSKNPEDSDFHWFRQAKDVLYTVKQGDTLSSIAKFFKTTQTYIKKHNPAMKLPLNPNDLLFIPDINVWSHKLGHATGALLTDSCGKAIKDPRKSCRTFSHTYDKFCGSYCVRRNKARTGI